jgi:fibronectin-binding autotransporter adhesin
VFRDGGPGGSTLHLRKIGTGAQTLASVVGISGDVTVEAGTLTLGAANTYSGNTVINGGMLKLGIATGIPSGTGKGNAIIAAAGTLDVAGFTGAAVNGLVGSGTVTNSGPAGPDVLNVGNNDSDGLFAGTIRDGGAGLAFIQLTKLGTGTLTVEGTNEYVGLTTVSAGALRVTANQALGHATVGNTLVSAGAALELAGGITVAESATINGTGPSGGGALRNLSGHNTWTGSISNGVAGTRVNADAGSSLNLAPAAGNAIYGTTLAMVFGGDGDIAINGPVGLTTANLTKDGGGVLRWNATDTFGATSKADVQAGTMLVNGTLGGSVSLTVQSGATLGGNGSTTRAVTSLTGGALAPGDPLVASGVGALTVKQLQLDAGSVLRFELSDETVRDRIVVQTANNLTIQGGNVHLFQPGTVTPFAADGNYDLMQYSGAIQGAGIAALTVANPQVGKTYTFEETGGWVRLRISSVTAWDGGDADDNLWSSGTNWLGDSAPAANAELRFDTGLRLSNTNDLGASLRFAGVVFEDGAGAFTLSGDAIDLTGAIINSSPNTQTIALPLRLDSNTRQLDAATGALIFSGAIGETGGTNGVHKTGDHLVTLGGTNTFGGAVTIASGAIRATSDAALGDTASGTTVNIGAALELAGGIAVGGEALNLSGDGVASDGALRNIAGDNTFGGTVTLATAGHIQSETNTLTLNVLTGSAIAGAGQDLTIGGDGDVVVADPITTTTGSLLKTGAGTLTLAATNTFTGLTTIDAGTVTVQTPTGLGTAAGGVIVADGASLLLDAAGAATENPITLDGGTYRNLSGNNSSSGNITLTDDAAILSDAGTLTINVTGSAVAGAYDLLLGGSGDIVFSDPIGAVTNLTKIGGGTVTFAGGNTYPGHTVVAGGMLKPSGGLPNGLGAGDLFIGPSGIVEIATTAIAVNGLWGSGIVTNNSTADNITVGVNDTTSLFSGSLRNNVNLIKSGTGALTLDGANEHNLTTVSGGTLEIGNGGTAGTLGLGASAIAADSTLVFNRAGTYTYGGGISGAGTVTLVGPGTIVAGGVWAQTGITTINAGALQLGALDRFAPGTAITIDGGIFDLNRFDESMGTITLLSGLIASTGDGGSLTGTNVIAASGTIAARLSDFTGTPLTPFTKVGGGTVSLTRADNLFAGKVAIQEGTVEVEWLARLSVGSSLGAPTTAANGTISLGSDSNAATLRVVGTSGDSFTDRILDLAGTTGPVTLDSSGSGILFLSTNLTATGSGAKTLELAGSQTGTNTLAGIIPDSAGGATSVAKSGVGTWVLRGANAYSGGTTVDGGLLVIANTTGSGTGTGGISVNTGATLGGSGSIAGTVTVNDGGTLQPGASVGTLAAGGLALAPGSLLAFEFNASPSNDQVRITATDGLTINGGGLYLYDEGTTDPWTTPGVYRLFEFAGTIQGSGVAALSVLNPQAGHTYDFRVEGNWVVLRLTAGVPLLTLLDASVTEGNSGTTALAFTLSLDPTSSVAVVANADTTDGTAKTANGDYEARSGAFNIPAGIATTQIVVNVTGELKYENNETLSLALSNVQNATVVRGSATGTINNDDAPDGRVYVDDTATGNNNGNNWDDAFTDLQDALRSAGPGQDIWVAKGTYLPTNGTARTAHFALRPANPVYGGFAGTETTLSQRNWMNATSILSGDIGNPGASFDNCGPIVRTQLGAGSLLDGFTLRDGNNGSGGSGGGGAINVASACGVTIQNCVFEYNYAGEGGAVQINADSTFRRCIFRNNSDGARGGAVQCYNSTDLFENCLFLNNTGGGRGGAMSLYNQTITLVNCTFVGNSAQAGNAFYASNGAYVNALNCIFWDSGDHGGGIWVKNPTSNPDPEFNWASGANLSFCDVRGGFTPPELGTSDNCIDSDPEFVLEGSDYHLTGTSPCRDTGTSSGAPADDLEGSIRPFGPGFDMGAYEYGASGTGTPPTGFMFFVR